MKRRILWVLVILAVGIFSTNILQAAPQEEEEFDNDNFGMVFGQLIDKDTGAPVKEYFWVYLQPHDKFLRPPEISMVTDKYGRFSNKVKPGLYVLYCVPYDESEYSIDPNPFKLPEVRQEIKVERGKITRIFKKVYRAGKLNVIIVDAKGSRLNPLDHFSDVSIRPFYERVLPDGSIDTSLLLPPESKREGSFDEGDWTQAQLYPGIYNMEIDFKFTNLGYGSRRFENIKIEKNKTTEVKVVLDLTDQTGVYGRVVDLEGNPVEEVKVVVSELVEKKGFRMGAVTYTDSNGNYKIIGLREGSYRLRFYKMFEPSLISVSIPSENIIIKRYKMIEKNREIKTPEINLP